MRPHADGGLITTKPYFSGSAYIRKMGNYKPGPWTAIWDGFYWRWILKNSETLAGNPRWAMMCAMARRLSKEKQATHLRHAESFLSRLS
jgi:deoxyribodipyrimidine photolyase-related protein